MYNKIKASMVETIRGRLCNFQIVFSSWSSLSLRFKRYISSLLRFREINNTRQPWSSSAWLAAAGYFSVNLSCIRYSDLMILNFDILNVQILGMHYFVGGTLPPRLKTV